MDIVFECKKCGHLLFVKTLGRSAEDIADILDEMNCPNCGESPEENWTFKTLGDFDSYISTGNVSCHDVGALKVPTNDEDVVSMEWHDEQVMQLQTRIDEQNELIVKLLKTIKQRFEIKADDEDMWLLGVLTVYDIFANGGSFDE